MVAAAIPVAASSGPVGWTVLGLAAVATGLLFLAKAGNDKPKKERSSDPIGKRYDHNSRKGGYEHAKRKSGGREPKGPEFHNDGHPPHYHSVDEKGKPTHHHFRFPKRQFSGPKS